MTGPRRGRPPKKAYDSEIVPDEVVVYRRPPATTPEARENQMVSLAFDLAERQIVEGTASAQVITHFLKLGSEREKMERKKLEFETKLLDSKIQDMAAQARVEELYGKALAAMQMYSGQITEGEDEASNDY